MQHKLEQPAFTSLWRVFERCPKPARIAFVSSFFGGLLTYLYALTNPLLCVGDALTNVVSTSNQVGLGRWSSAWLCSLSPELSMPLVNGLIMLLATSLLAGVVVVYVEMQSPLLAAAAGLVLALYPSVGNTLKYVHLADGYQIAALLAVVSLFVTDRYRFGWLAGIPLLVLALGTYQANLSLVVALMLVRALQLLIKPGVQVRSLLWLALRYLLYAAAALAAYYVLVGVFSRQYGIPLSDYQSVSNMGQWTPALVWDNFIACYRDFRKEITFLSFRPGFYVNGYANYLYVLLAVGLIGAAYLSVRGKTPLKTALLMVLLALSPFLLCSIHIFNPATVYSLMTYSVAGLYLIGLVAMERLPDVLLRLAQATQGKVGLMRSSLRGTRVLLVVVSWVLIICLAVCLYAWAAGINVDYYSAQLDYGNMYAQCSLYLSLAEAADGYTHGMPIYVLGTAGAGASSRANTLLNSPKAFYAFMKFMLGVQMPYGIAGDINRAAEQFMEGAAYRQMPAYPADGCAVVSDGAVYVKLAEAAR